MACNHNHCGACCGSNGGCAGDCSSCGGGGALYVTPAELTLLKRFAEMPFLPVARRPDAETPICFEELSCTPAETAQAAFLLARKGLIRIDYDMPLRGFDAPEYLRYFHHGSMALTARGIAVLELLDIQGIKE